MSCWLALDGGPRPAGYVSSDAEDRVDASLAEALTVVLHDEQIDPLWYPFWRRLDLGLAAGSFLLQDSLAFAVDELEPDRLAQGSGRRVAGWLEVQGDGASAALHIARKMIQRHPAHGRQLIRLHDPAVLWAIWPALSTEQQAGWLGPIRRWHLLDPAGNLVSLIRPDADTDGAALSAAQWNDIENVTALNGAFRRWLPHGAAQAAMDVERARAVASKALRRARDAGFSDTDDLVSYASHALLVHPEFDSHPLVQRALDRRVEGQHYGALIEGLTDEDWASVKQHLSGHPTAT